MSADNTNITIALHLGAPQTDEDQLTWSLRKDSVLLKEKGVMIRRPGTYRRLINDALNEISGKSAKLEIQQNLMSTIIKDQKVDRLIISNSHFMGVPSWMFNNGLFYRNAGRNVAKLRNLFPENPCELFLAIRNPATFIPEAFSNQTAKNYNKFIDGIDLNSVRWSDVVTDIQQQNPDCPITVWCNEDTPTIWSTIMSKIAGLSTKIRFAGELDIINGIMSEEAIGKLKAFIDDRPELTDLQRREVKATFLEKLVDQDAVEEVIDLPGWTEELVEEMTESYEYDTEVIENLPDVEFISS